MTTGQSLSEIIVVLGVFVGATFRILPSVNRILSSMQNIKFYYSSVDIIINEFKTIKNKKVKSKINFNEKLNF